jgi:hypothetical protein
LTIAPSGVIKSDRQRAKAQGLEKIEKALIDDTQTRGKLFYQGFFIARYMCYSMTLDL